jgi:hypothetical protein
MFDSTISLGNILTFLGFVGSLIAVTFKLSAKITEKEVTAAQKHSAIESRIALTEQAQGFFKLRQEEDRLRHDNEMREIKTLLKEIYDKLDDKADKED